MPKLSPIVSLDKALSELLKRRQEHQSALAEIDAVFAKYGIHPEESAPPVKSLPALKIAPPAKGRRRTRQKYPETAEQFVLNLVKGGKGATSREINTAWKDSGRKNSADNALTLLVKKKVLKRTPLKEGRGSQYTVA